MARSLKLGTSTLASTWMGDQGTPGKTGHCEPGFIRWCGLESVTDRLYCRYRADTDVTWIEPNYWIVNTILYKIPEKNCVSMQQVNWVMIYWKVHFYDIFTPYDLQLLFERNCSLYNFDIIYCHRWQRFAKFFKDHIFIYLFIYLFIYYTSCTRSTKRKDRKSVV